ncbi:MAG: tRNA (N(6)-L-threonylcarbamoyladenosine(37)-C(2))-methylthiotransferase MtaB [Saprospiraceae bacterium]|nr:tRNA (N(6)-L-threonylcarbamoyladenosine(37)-C(2))-methylthiotransferase MtaB [Saprospiraceae bacterium]
MSDNKRVAIYTLGCKLNYSESSTIGMDLMKSGYDVVDFEENPDIFIINTCSVTDFADKKNRKIIRRAKKINPASRVVVIGCYAQLKPDEIIRIEGVDLVLGANEKFRVAEHLQSESDEKLFSCQIEEISDFHYSFSYGERTRSFLKIQTGCDYICTYCTIPKARGKSRSGDPEEILRNAREIAAKGIREIVLTGVNIGDYGMGIDKDNVDFLYLLKKLDSVEGIERIRISSIEPNLLTDEIIDFVADSRAVVPHFHIPLQSGSDKILQLMKRRYLTDLYAGRIDAVRQRIPHAGIGVDVIVGFPGESDADFNDTYQFIEGLDISYLHVFTFSERAGTQATSMSESVPVNIRRERNEILTGLSNQKRSKFYDSFLQTNRKVLAEKADNMGTYSGFTDNYIKVNFESYRNIENTIVNVLLEWITPENEVWGKIM